MHAIIQSYVLAASPFQREKERVYLHLRYVWIPFILLKLKTYY